jgi:hypothetical protein
VCRESGYIIVSQLEGGTQLAFGAFRDLSHAAGPLVEFDREKLKRLVHYVAWNAGKRPGFGATKLYKVLWYADARTYLLTGTPITGASYIREKFGPMPSAKQFMPVRDELVREGKLKVIESRTQFDTTQFLALEPPETAFLSDREKQTVDYQIERIDKDHTAQSISDETHEDYSWQIAKTGEELPLYALRLARIKEPTEEERERFLRRAKELGLT